MKLPETTIKFVTTPEADSYLNFAIECRRDISYINKAVAGGKLNWGHVNGMKMVILDELAEAFKEKCRALDNHKRLVKKQQP